MDILLESHRRRWLSPAALLSLGLHAVVVGGIVMAYGEADPAEDQLTQMVVFLAPPDRPAGGGRDSPEQVFAPETQAVATDQASQDAVQVGEGPLEKEPGVDTSAISFETSALQELLKGSVLTELEVDSTVRRDPSSAAPMYPPNLLAENIEGSADVLFVVDSTGVVDLSSFRVLRATHQAFADAVRLALPLMRFRPALLAGTPVNQLVQQNFAFRIRSREPIPPQSSTR